MSNKPESPPAAALREALALLGDEHPQVTYTGEGYAIWLEYVAHGVVNAANAAKPTPTFTWLSIPELAPPPYELLQVLAGEASAELARCDEGDYTSRHRLMDYVGVHPDLIVRLMENEEDRMALLVEDLDKTKRERDAIREENARMRAQERVINQWLAPENTVDDLWDEDEGRRAMWIARDCLYSYLKYGDWDEHARYGTQAAFDALTEVLVPDDE